MMGVCMYENVALSVGQYRSKNYAEQMSADSAKIFNENGQTVHPFSECAACVGLESIVSRFSKSESHLATSSQSQFH
jgi:hypothetical protein